MDATQITEEEFFDATNHYGSSPFHRPEEWWRQGDRFGLVIHDRVDHDWSWVAMAQNPHDKKWQMYDGGIDNADQEQARVQMLLALEKSLEEGWYR